MPKLSRWFIRSAMIYLLLGFTIGGLILANKGIAVYPQIWRLLPVHIEFLLMGWTVQLAMGVAFWILPRFYTERRRERFAWLAFVLLNLGCWFVVTDALRIPQSQLLLAGRMLEICAILAFVFHAWPRIKRPMQL